MIAVFAYDFPHRKTQDFLLELVSQGQRDLCVLAAPWKPLPVGGASVPVRRTLRPPVPLDTRKLCEALGLTCVSVDHGDAAAIGALRDRYGFELGIIAGARIIKRPVIELFAMGIVNFHPGPIPETSGLDALYYSILKNVSMGVTAHYIDSRIDAGHHIFFEPLVLGSDDDFEVVEENMRHNQVIALRRFLGLLEEGDVPCAPINRPEKNPPMDPVRKVEALAQFPVWRTGQYLNQQTSRLFAACEAGRLEDVKSLVARFPALVDQRNLQGWTPLIVAAFNGRLDTARCLLEAGASPDAAGRNGTTPLMYAKTNLINQPDVEPLMLDLLIEYGADVQRTDVHGRDVLSYVREAGDERLTTYFESRTS